MLHKRLSCILLNQENPLKKAIKDQNRNHINNPYKEINIPNGQLEEIQMQFMWDPHNNTFWMKEKDLQEQIQNQSIEREIY